jgi:hypothetical protein
MNKATEKYQEKKTKVFASEIPIDLYYNLLKIKEEFDRKGQKVTIRDMVQEGLNMYCNSLGYPEVR